MLRYIVKRILMVIPVILGVLTIVFILQAITPGDPVDQLLSGNVSEEVREAKREELGLNDPIIVQFGRYVYHFVTEFDLGTSYKTGQPVSAELLARYPTTIKLALGSVFLGILIGIPLGVIAAVNQYKWIDSVALVISMIAQSMPGFWLALMLISLFSVRLGWLPASGIQTASGWVLPIVVVGFGALASMVRITRSSMLEVIRQDYIRTARAKGQTEFKVTVNHALRSAMIPIMASIGNTLGIQLGGALIIESVFGMPGIGKYVTDAITARNYPAVDGGVVLLAITFTIVNLLVDISYTFVDPRMKNEFAAKPTRRSSRKKALKAEEVA